MVLGCCGKQFSWMNVLCPSDTSRSVCINVQNWVNGPLIGTEISKHNDVIKWKHFPRYWPFVRGIHRSPVNSPHKGQWRGALMFSLICVWINRWVNNREAGDLRRYLAHYYVTVMASRKLWAWISNYSHLNLWDIIAYTCPKFNADSTKKPLKLA